MLYVKSGCLRKLYFSLNRDRQVALGFHVRSGSTFENMFHSYNSSSLTFYLFYKKGLPVPVRNAVENGKPFVNEHVLLTQPVHYMSMDTIFYRFLFFIAIILSTEIYY